MDAAWAVSGGLAGLPVGTLLRRPVYQFSVRSGEPDRTTCRWCAATLRSWPAFRCADCGRLLGPALLPELAAAIVLALLLGRFAGQPVSVAFGFFGVLGVALAAIDVAVQRLPDRLTLPAYPILILLLVAAAVLGHQGGALVRALLGSASLAAAFLVMALLRPGQLGGGDVKLAGLAGLTLGWLGWRTLLLGTVLGFVICAIFGLVLLATRRITLTGTICYAPFLLSGAILAMLTT